MRQFLLLAVLGLFAAVSAFEPPCGGALDGDVGTFHFYDAGEELPDDRNCIWIIRLHSTTNISVSIDDVEADTSIGVFSSEQASSSFPVVPPLYVFNASTVGTTFRSRFSTVILVLNPSLVDREFTISWRGEAPGTGLAPIESANYIDADHGTLEQDDFGLSVLALVLNPPQGDKVNLEVKVLGHEEDCANLAYAVFELNPAGSLREVARTCGRPVTLANVRTPLIAFVAKPTLQQSETISFTWNTVNAPADSSSSCGGSLQSNQGLLRYEDVGDPLHACAWTLRLQSKAGFRLTLHDLNAGGGAGIFSSEQAGSPFPVIEPTHQLGLDDIGRPLDTDGDVIIVILNPSSDPRRISIAWDGLVDSPAGSPESASYFDANEGELIQSNEHLALLAWILNPPLALPLDVEVKVLGFEEGCANLAYSVFEVLPVGNLREVARTCGRPVQLYNVRPPLIAFVARPDLTDSDTVSLKWTSVRPDPEDGSTTTQDPSLVVSETCGGVLVGAAGIIRYKINGPYERNERCTWTIRANLFSQVRLQLVDDGLYTVPGFDFLTISTIPSLTGATVRTDEIINGGFRSPVDVVGPIVFVTFRTAQGGSRGFELHYEGLGSNVASRAFHHRHFNTSLDSLDTFTHPAAGGNYENNELTTLVFNQGVLNLQYSLALRLTYVDIENNAGCTYDVLAIHESNPTATVQEHDRICPRLSSVDRLFTGSIDSGAFILVFRTDGSVVYEGFRGEYSYLRT